MRLRRPVLGLVVCLLVGYVYVFWAMVASPALAPTPDATPALQTPPSLQEVIAQRGRGSANRAAMDALDAALPASTQVPQRESRAMQKPISVDPRHRYEGKEPPITPPKPAEQPRTRAPVNTPDERYTPQIVNQQPPSAVASVGLLNGVQTLRLDRANNSAMLYARLAEVQTTYPHLKTIFDRWSAGALLEDSMIGQQLVFVHLAKTGGTALGTVVRRAYPIEAFIMWAAPDKGAAVSKVIASKKFIFAHVPYGVHNWLPGSYTPPYYGTMLREPVSRVISHYWYHKGNVKDANHYLAKNRTIGEWVQEIEYGNNAMTVFLSGASAEAWWYENVTVALDGNEMPLKLPQRPAKYAGPITSVKGWEVTEAHYQKARENLLNTFGFVGLTEKMEESKVLFSYFTNWKKIAATTSDRKLNVGKSKSKEPVSEADKAIIMDANKYDIKLYELAKEIYAAQVAVFGGEERLAKAVATMHSSGPRPMTPGGTGVGANYMPQGDYKRPEWPSREDLEKQIAERVRNIPQRTPEQMRAEAKRVAEQRARQRQWIDERRAKTG